MARAKDTLASSFEDLRNDYSAAKTSRFRRKRTGVSATGAGADYHYRNESDFLKILEVSRDMDRNDTIVGHLVNRAVDCTIHGGLTLDPQTGNEKLNSEISERWAEWSLDADKCDAQGQLTFNQMEEMIFRSMLVDGDVFLLPLESGALQVVESHRCRTPYGIKANVVHGVELDPLRKRVKYHFTADDIDPMSAITKSTKMSQVGAYDSGKNKQVFHVYNPKRVTQTRGVSALAPIFDTLGMFEDIQFAELVRRQIVSCFAVFRMREQGFSGPGAAPLGATQSVARSDGSMSKIEGISPGMMIEGSPGEKLQGFSPNVPGPDFFPHVKLILTLCSINLGLPLCLALLDASETNFSGFRGALDQAKIGWKRNQRLLKARSNTPVYLWKLRQWMAEDEDFAKRMSRSTVKPFKHVWNSPTWPYIDPLKDATADITRLSGGLTSPRRLHAERGDDVDQLARETVEDNAYRIRLAKEAAQKINADFEDDNMPVHWRELISLPLPKGFTIAASPAFESQPQQGATNDLPE
jgi:lambda family phage portal protein